MVHLGRILEVNLSEGNWAFSHYPREVGRRFLGGRGFNVWLLHQEVLPGTAPLGPDNVLLFSCGLLTGTAAPASSRLHVNALSPLTSILGSSNLGGDFGVGLRSCDIHSLILRGKAPKPVYLFIDDGTVEIRDARSLWGLETWETEKRLKGELGEDHLRIVTIGPAGENKALFACIMSDRDHAAGRTGMGAVMGSKNLKALVLKAKGQHQTSAFQDNPHDVVKQYLRRIVDSPEFRTISRYGGAGYLKWANDMGILATHNYRENRFTRVDLLDGKRLRKYVTRSRSCHRCPVHCKADLQLHPGSLDEREAVRPEFEPMVSLGSKCGLSDLRTLVYLDNLCSRLGLDSISAGGAIAFAMDLYDRGLLTLEDTGGLDLSWGKGESMEVLIQQMAKRDGLGAVLSQGVRNAAKIIGRGSEKFAFHVKGLELSGYHPSEIMGTALGYAVANRGGDFNDIYANLEYRLSPEEAPEQYQTQMTADIQATDGKAVLVRKAMMASVVLDSLGLCKVPALSIVGSFDLASEAELTSALTGRLIDPQKLLEIGERIINLERLFNLRHGATSEDDRLPRLVLKTKRGSKGKSPHAKNWLEPMKLEFYQAMGWDQQGRPSKAKLKELDLWQYVLPEGDD